MTTPRIDEASPPLPPLGRQRLHDGRGLQISGRLVGDRVDWVAIEFSSRMVALRFVLSVLFVWRHRRPVLRFLGEARDLSEKP